jgi:hypothetical protein
MSEEPTDPAALEGDERNPATHLTIARPVPGAGFRGALSRRLSELDRGYGPRPERLRLMVAGYLGAGGLLIALAAVGLS